MSLWSWLDGKKTTIGAGLSLLNLLSPTVGLKPEVASIVGTVASAIMGIGIAFKAAKVARRSKAPTVTPLILVAVALALSGCAAVKSAIPEAQFSLGFMGATIGVDTRKVTDPVIAASKSVADTVTDTVGLTAPAPK